MTNQVELDMKKIEKKLTAKARMAQEEESLKFAVNYVLSEFCLDTSAHGFKNMHKTTNKFIRFVWIVLIIASFCYISYCKS